MRVLITGGYGMLGYHLCQKLIEQEHDVVVIDQVDRPEFSIPCEELGSHEYAGVDFKLAVVKYKPTHVIHCAEITDPRMSMWEHAAYTNVGFTTQVLHTCSANGIRCVVPTWKELLDSYNADSVWECTAAWKAKLVLQYHKGNAVNTTVALPRILSKYQRAYFFGAVVKRLYNSIVKQSEFMITQHELGLYTTPWITIEDATDMVITTLNRRVRGCISSEDYIKVDPKIIIEQVLHFMNVYAMNVHIDKYVHGFKARNDLEEPLHSYIKLMIDEWEHVR